MAPAIPAVMLRAVAVPGLTRARTRRPGEASAASAIIITPKPAHSGVDLTPNGLDART
jgi:hypothetical protein